jgi:hypothetical protein
MGWGTYRRNHAINGNIPFLAWFSGRRRRRQIRSAPPGDDVVVRLDQAPLAVFAKKRPKGRLGRKRAEAWREGAPQGVGGGGLARARVHRHAYATRRCAPASSPDDLDRIVCR